MFDRIRWIFQVVLIEIACLSQKFDVKLCILFHIVHLAVSRGSIKTRLHLLDNGSKGGKGLDGRFE